MNNLCIGCYIQAFMAKWEFAALVHVYDKDGNNKIWHLVKPAEVEPAELEYNEDGDENRRKTRSFGPKWCNPRDWHSKGRIVFSDGMVSGESYDSILEDSRLNSDSIDGGSEPNIILSSRDLLTLINLAGAEGWKITGGINIDHGEEIRYQVMRREL